MCGIVGFTEKNEIKLRGALKSLAHRGPDDSGFFIDENVSLGHHRLSILDLSAAGSQPMIGNDGNLVIIYNGEIYNFRELKKDLEGADYIFQGRSDTEVILNGYKKYGTAFFSRMRGMWALAIYDKARGKVVLSRDYFGIKPLLYAVRGGSFYFASEMRALVRLLDNLEPNAENYYQYFNFGYFIPPQTCYREVKKMRPGEILVWDINKKEYKTEKAELIDSGIEQKYVANFDEAVELVNESLLNSVRAHYVSDVPVGLLLSGGNDSSLLAAMSVVCGQKPVAYNLHIKGSIDYEYAVKVSKHLGLELVSKEMTEARLAEQYEKIWEILDEPTSDSSIIPTSLIYSVITGKAKVVLSGEGGDEMFGGYLRHLALARPDRVVADNPLVNLFNFFGSGNSALELNYINPAVNRARNFFLDKIQNDIIGIYLARTKKIDYPYRYGGARKRLYDFWQGFDREAGGANNLFFDRWLYLPNDLMYKADMSSMAYSIESRVPFLDKNFYNMIIKRIPALYQLSPQYTGKAILKKVMEKYLPQELIYRPKKGFSFSFRKYCFDAFTRDYGRAAAFHLQNADIFGISNSGVDKILRQKNNSIIINKYPGFVFALITNYKIFI